MASLVRCLCLPGGQRYVSVQGRSGNRAPPVRKRRRLFKIQCFTLKELNKLDDFSPLARLLKRETLIL